MSMSTSIKKESSVSRVKKTMPTIALTAITTIYNRLPGAFQDIEKILLDHYKSTEFVGLQGVSENSRIIAEHHRSVDVLDQQVDEALE